MRLINSMHCVFFNLLILSSMTTTGAITEYLSHIFNGFLSNGKIDKRRPIAGEQNDELVVVPYELSVSDEKFIQEAIKLTGVKESSELDKCQHRIVLQLQTSCQKMNDEQLAKMGVMLLNCQSLVEGRQVYPCTESMTLRECTNEMDPTAWNAYHITSNRARAVCYYVRNLQFRGLTERTVDRLMNAASWQIDKLGEIARGQNQLQAVTKETLKTIDEGYTDLFRQQEDLKQVQLHSQLTIENNLMKLADEKWLIEENRRLFQDITARLSAKVESALSQLDVQSEKSKTNQRRLIEDILKVQRAANSIFSQFDRSWSHLVDQNLLVQSQLNRTVDSLRQINETVTSLVTAIGGTKTVLDERLSWIANVMGGTDVALDRLNIVVWHFCFLIGSMIACAFLNANAFVRTAVVVLVPLNGVLSVNHWPQCVDAIGLTAVILTLTALQLIFAKARDLHRRRIENVGKRPKSVPLIDDGKKNDYIDGNEITDEDDDNLDDRFNLRRETSERRSRREQTSSSTSFYDGDVIPEAPTPPLSRNSRYESTLSSPCYERMKTSTPSVASSITTSSFLKRSLSRTPLLLNLNLSSERRICSATTRLGTPCKLKAQHGRDYCFKHQEGDSIMG